MIYAVDNPRAFEQLVVLFNARVTDLAPHPTDADVYQFDDDGDSIPEEALQNAGTVTLANVPTGGRTTFYSLAGDLLGWGSLLGVMAIIAYVVAFSRRR